MKPRRTDVIATTVGVLAAVLVTGGVKAAIVRARIDDRVESLTKGWPFDDATRTRMGRVVERELRPVFASPAFDRFLKENPGREAQLPPRGMVRLNDAELAAHLAIKKRLAFASEAVCACAWDGQECSQADNLRALSMLSDEELGTWYLISARATLAELEATEPPPSRASDYDEGIRAIIDGLGTSERERFLEVSVGNAVSKTDKCFAMRTLFTRLEALEPALRARFTRAMLNVAATR